MIDEILKEQDFIEEIKRYAKVKGNTVEYNGVSVPLSYVINYMEGGKDFPSAFEMVYNEIQGERIGNSTENKGKIRLPFFH